MKAKTHLSPWLLVVLILIGTTFTKFHSQEILRIHKTDNTIVLIPVSEIMSPTFSGSSAVPEINTMTDFEGNVYKTVKIGDQIWMAENLRSSSYNDGTPILELAEGKDWSSTQIGAFCWYANNEDTYNELYGKLYNWNAVNSKKLAPAGWRVPTDADWAILIEYLGGDKEAGGKLKSTDPLHWRQPNIGATNITGFSAYTGMRYATGVFYGIQSVSAFWSASEDFSKPVNAWSRSLSNGGAGVSRTSNNKNSGFYIRLVKE